MQSGRLLVGSAAAMVCIATVAATVHLRQIKPHVGAVPAAGKARLFAYGGRTAQQRASAPTRMDSALAGIAAHAATLSSAKSIADFRNFNPATRFRSAAAGAVPEVAIDAATHGDVQQLKSALVALGLEHPAVFANSVGGWLPVTAINAAAASPEVAYIHASLPHRRAVVATQGDYAQQSYAIRQAYPSLTGAGVTVGVISDSFDCYAVYALANSGVPASGNQGYASNGFTATAEDDEASGALPPASAINVLAEPYTPGADSPTGDCLNYGAPAQLPFTDEGRAMMQVVHAVAPGANLAFYTGDNSEADFATGITKLASPVSSGGAGAKVIADDLGYYDEPFYQDGIIAQAIDTVEAAGVAYFSAAGNNGNASWESTSPSFPVQQSTSAATNPGEYLLNFDTTGQTTATTLPITLSPLVPGEYVAIVVEWDQPYVTGAPNSGGATNQIDVCVSGATGAVVQNYDGATKTCTGLNATGVDPVQVLTIGNPANASGNTGTLSLSLSVGTNSQSTAPHRLIVSVETDGQTSPVPISSYATNSETIQGHPNAAGAAAVAAAFYFDTSLCGTSPAQLEPYSSQGGAPILFSSTGDRLGTPIIRQKPDFVGPDGVNNTFLGFTLASGGVTGADGLLNTSNGQCQNNPDYPNFFGTSAATPHAAGIAALMLQDNSAVTPAEIYSALENSATAIGQVPTTGASPTYNFTAGYGFINAEAAVALIPIGPPTLTLAASGTTIGSSTTITWSSIDASGCTASGAWSGPLGASGTQTLTPTTVGTQTYTLACTSFNGSLSTPTSVSLNVTTQPQAPVLSLSATSIALGTSATLTWSDVGGTSCMASGSGWSGTEATSGTATETPTATGTYTYTLMCANAAGNSLPTTVTLNVVSAPTATLSASSLSVTAGSPATLSWSSTNSTACTASGGWTGTLGTSGSTTETPTAVGTYTFTLKCSNGSVVSAPSTVTLDVIAPPPTASLTASANSVVVGSTATLTWSSTNAASCTASGSWTGALAASGSQTVTPTTTGSFTYTLICSNGNGTASSSPASVTLTVTAKSSGGGGGAFDGVSLLVLGGIAAGARITARRRRVRL